MDAAAEAFKLTDEAAGSHVGALAAQEPVAAQFGRKVRPRRNPVFDHRAHCQIQLAKVLADSRDATRRRKAGRVLGQRQRPSRTPAIPSTSSAAAVRVTECAHDVRPNPHANRLTEPKSPHSPRKRIDRK